MKKTIPIIFVIFTTIFMLVTGCSKESADSDFQPDTFNTTYTLGEEGMTVSISGNSNGHVAGEQSEFQLKMHNSTPDESWKGDYCVLLIDREGVIEEITHDKYDIPAGNELQKDIIVDLPVDIEGALGLCFVLPDRASAISTIWVGETRTGEAGPWPEIKTCPRYLTVEYSRKIAEEFIINCPTFTFDGNPNSLELIETLYSDIENSWHFIFKFESSHAGYGDRTGQVLAQVITQHEAIITVEDGIVVNAIMDNKWHMINQMFLN